jgi:hypothetical protein
MTRFFCSAYLIYSLEVDKLSSRIHTRGNDVSEEVRKANMAGQDEIAPVDKRIKQSRDLAKWYFISSISLVFIYILGNVFFRYLGI